MDPSQPGGSLPGQTPEDLPAAYELATLVESSPEAIIATTLDGSITRWNPAATTLFGWSAEEAVGRSMALIVPPEQAPELEENLARLRRGERVEHFETVRLRKDGKRIEVSLIIAPVKDAAGTIIGTLALARDIGPRRQVEELARAHQILQQETELRRQAEDALQGERELLQALLGTIAEGVITCDLQGHILYTNRAAQDLIDLLGSPFPLDHWEESIQVYLGDRKTPIPKEDLPLYRVLRGEPIENEQAVIVPKSGKPRRLLLSARALLNAARETAGAIVTFQDVTQRQEMEERLLQVQKMEAIGQLAGGVAHDFNNLLTIINGYSDMLHERLRQGPLNGLVTEIKRAGERAASLTHQLLTFSRKQFISPQQLNLGTVLGDMEKMIRRLIGEDIELIIRFPANLGRVKADLGQIQQVIMNLVVNARDAMPAGGTLTIALQNQKLDQGLADLRSGDYVLLTISDTGQGMPPEIRDKVFEPFFTTKSLGQGSGLGLATVYGIIKQSGGHVEVESRPGKGTVFRIFLPCVPSAPGTGRSSQEILAGPTGTETVLVVEDEEAVRSMVQRVLQDRGYTVLEAANGREALQVCARHQGPIHLLVTDVVMPELGGRQLAEQLKASHPETKTIFISGYTEDEIMKHGLRELETNFLQKPFSLFALVRKVREVLDSEESPPPA